MIKTIGVVGLGFVGTAVMEGLKHAFNVYGYDKIKGCHYALKGESTSKDNSLFPSLAKLTANTDGPIFICVPTPMNKDGSCHTDIVEGVVKELAELAPGRTLVIKSTVAPGTTARLNKLYPQVGTCFNPEFLTERNFIEDFKNQDRIIIGGPHKSVSQIKRLYEAAYPNVQVTKTDATIAEMVKYTTNCFLATKVAFANEIAQLCDKLEIDYDKVVEYATKDKRLGTSHWAVPGPDGIKGYGGHCLPKDLNAIIALAEQLGVNVETLKGCWHSNLSVRSEKDWESMKGRAVL